MPEKHKRIFQIKIIARTLTLIFSAFWFGFALLSGAETFGGGIRGILRNSPNALPWFFLLTFTFLYWYYEIISASLIMLIGLVSLFFFDAFQSPFVLFAISIPILILGSILLITALLSRTKIQQKQ